MILVISGNNTGTAAVKMRRLHASPQGAKPRANVAADILADIKKRRA